MYIDNTKDLFMIYLIILIEYQSAILLVMFEMINTSPEEINYYFYYLGKGKNLFARGESSSFEGHLMQIIG